MGVFPLVAEALSATSIPTEPGFLGLDAATLEATFRWANRIRPATRCSTSWKARAGLMKR